MKFTTKILNLVYDPINNTIEYTNEGVEHYEYLMFYNVGEFSKDTYTKIDEGVFDDQKVYLTRENLPKKIFGIHRDGHMEAIEY